jgi:hypothetical protein
VTVDSPRAAQRIREDVNGDGQVTAVDAVLIANWLNAPPRLPMASANGGTSLDVDGDGRVTPVDALRVINALNSRALNSRASQPFFPSLASNLNSQATDTSAPLTAFPGQTVEPSTTSTLDELIDAIATEVASQRR